MSQLDILFWLLIALLAGVGWAIEAGLTARHRRVLACSTLSAFASVLFIMFWVEDKSQFVFGKLEPIKVKQKKGQTRGEFKVVVEEVEGQPDNKEWNPYGDETDEEGKKEGADGKPLDPNALTKEYRKDPFLDCPVCPEMVIIRAGTFDFGSPVNEPGRVRGERVAKPETIQKPFAVGRLEILRGEFEAFVKETRHVPAPVCDIQRRTNKKWNWTRPGFEQDEGHPVVCVNWEDARRYTSWLSDKTGRTYRLLTEAEWEYAARAGTSTAFWTGADVLRTQANFGKTRDGTIVAGLLPSNTFGVGGAIGNAAEMTIDCADPRPEPGDKGKAAPTNSMTGEKASGASGAAVQAAVQGKPEPVCNLRVVKGGGWNHPKQVARSAARMTMPPGEANNSTGFRVLRVIDERDDDKRLTQGQLAALMAAEAAARELEAKEKAEAEEAIRKAREEALQELQKKEEAERAKREKAAKK